MGKVLAWGTHDNLYPQSQSSLMPSYLETTEILEHRLYFAELDLNLDKFAIKGFGEIRVPFGFYGGGGHAEFPGIGVLNFF